LVRCVAERTVSWVTACGYGIKFLQLIGS